MPDVLALDDIDNKFGDVFCMVANPLNRFCHEQQIQAGRNSARIFHHVGDQFANKTVKLLVNLIVFFQDGHRNRRVESGKGIERFSEQARSQFRCNPKV